MSGKSQRRLQAAGGPPEVQKICGVVVTFHPAPGIAAKLRKIAAIVDTLIVVDNSASPRVSALLAPVAAQMGAALMHNPRNLGIATALNQGVDFARTRGADWVLFFDQDSEPNEDFRAEFGRVFAAYEEVQPLGVLGCNYFLSGTSVPRYPTQAPGGKNYAPITSVITSGSAYAMPMLVRLGPFKEEYFIDCVDTEYCWRARAHGYAVCITNRPLITHTIGAPSSHRVLGRSLTTWNHRALRRYFIGRNNVLLFLEYFRRFPRDSFDLLVYVLKTGIKISVSEQERPKKLSYLLRGIWHGMRRRLDGMPQELRH
jgi:rhamnosyltransferase